MRGWLVLLLVAVVSARLAPHYLGVGSGIGMPSSVKDKYHSTDVLLGSIEKLSSSCKYLTRHEVQAIDPTSGAQRGNSAYTLTDPDTPKDQKKRFLLTFGMHGREYISSEVALNLVQYTCNKMYAQDKGPSAVSFAIKEAGEPTTQFLAQLSSRVKIDRSRLLNILRTTEIVFIPVLNVDGRKKVEAGASCTDQRKNSRNVDINRNFADWFNPNNASPQDEDYQGPFAMSEWESNIVKTLAQQFHPHAYIDIHSGDLGLGFVFGHSGVERSPDDQLNRNWIRSVNQEVFDGQVWAGNLANMGSMPYESHGSSCDYMYRSHGVKISGTWEVWRKSTFFANTANANSQSVSSGVSGVSANKAADASKFDYVTTTVTSIPTVNQGQANMLALQPVVASQSQIQVESALIPTVMLSIGEGEDSTTVPQADELQSLVHLGMEASSNGEVLGLTHDDMQSLVQTMKADGHSTNEIQVLLQDMSREQCFAYFNPIMPEHYDNTVFGFTMAVLIGAEKLSAPDVAVAFK